MRRVNYQQFLVFFNLSVECGKETTGFVCIHSHGESLNVVLSKDLFCRGCIYRRKDIDPVGKTDRVVHCCRGTFASSGTEFVTC